MAGAAAAAILAPAAVSLVSNLLSANKQAEFQRRQEREQKAALRRAAIERAIGAGIVRPQEPMTPPNLFPYQAVNALAGLPWQDLVREVSKGK